jgi:hypothetical protein
LYREQLPPIATLKSINPNIPRREIFIFFDSIKTVSDLSKEGRERVPGPSFNRLTAHYSDRSSI